MHSSPSIARRLTLALASSIILLVNTAAFGQGMSYEASFTVNKEAIPVNVLVGQSRVINFDRPVGRFSVSNPDIAEAVLVTPDQVLVNGKAFGQVNFIAWEQSGTAFLVFDVYVRANLSLIDSQMRVLFPKDDIRLSQANGSVVLSGSVSSPATAAQAQSVVEAAGFKAVNMLTSANMGIQQVQLQVRVAEVSRNKARELGSSFATFNNGTSTFTQGGGPTVLTTHDGGSMTSNFIGSAVNFFLYQNALGMAAYVRALQTNGALRSLAEPNLVCMDGQEASFLAGGEFPIPMIQGGSERSTVTVVFKEYGIRLKFKPTIIDEDHIRLTLEPEVSTIDFTNGVRFDGFLIPALRTRRASTSVELRNGQSFALAGLLDNSETRSLSKIPVLGDIPILGALFKSKSFQKNETELMFIVTAQLVKPINPDDLPQMRGIDGLKNGSPLGLEPKGTEIQGKTGFSIGQPTESVPAEAPKTVEPAEAEKPSGAKTKETGTESTESVSVSSNRRINRPLPVAKGIPVNFTSELVSPK
jgi:pilus assembly protein CpaC